MKTPIVGQIINVTRHPNANKLYIAKVDVGQDKPVQIIFGGDYLLKSGELVAVALPGTRLPSGEKIRPRNWRGIKSYGEILSADELYGTSGGLDETLVLSPKNFIIGEIVNRA